MRQSSKTALGGIIAALSLILMLVSTVIPFLTYVLPAFAGTVLIIMVIEIGKSWAFVTYVSVSLLSLILLADKETAMMYAAFFGFYPIVKNIYEAKLSPVLCKIAKFLTFNISVVLAYLVIVFVFGIPFDDMGSLGKWGIPLLLVMGNILFVLYDFLLTRLITIYSRVWRKNFRSIFR